MIINSAARAVDIALDLVGTGIYELGTGNYNTPRGGKSDCAGLAINRCYNIRRHRPGFNVGSWATVSDDINCNSAIEDARHKKELFELVSIGYSKHPKMGEATGPNEAPHKGDLLTYPTFWSGGHQFIGHIAIIVDVPAEWDVTDPDKYRNLIVVQCRGPNGRNPGIVKSSAMHWDAHDKIWPKPEHRSVIIRVRPEVQEKDVG